MNQDFIIGDYSQEPTAPRGYSQEYRPTRFLVPSRHSFTANYQPTLTIARRQPFTRGKSTKESLYLPILSCPDCPGCPGCPGYPGRGPRVEECILEPPVAIVNHRREISSVSNSTSGNAPLFGTTKDVRAPVSLRDGPVKRCRPMRCKPTRCTPCEMQAHEMPSHEAGV